MNVKLQIKEVKVETRPITLEEKCMFLLSTDMHYSQEIRDEIEKRIVMLGLIRRVDSENVLFREETIRDATPQERMAWMYLNMVGEDRCPNGSGIGCGPCIFETCIAHTTPRLKAKSKLYNKEVIVSLTEESI